MRVDGVDGETDSAAWHALSPELGDQPFAQRRRVGEEGLADTFEEPAHQLPPLGQQIFDPQREESPAPGRKVVTRTLEERADRLRRAEPADRFLETQPDPPPRDA